MSIGSQVLILNWDPILNLGTVQAPALQVDGLHKEGTMGITPIVAAVAAVAVAVAGMAGVQVPEMAGQTTVDLVEAAQEHQPAQCMLE